MTVTRFSFRGEADFLRLEALVHLMPPSSRHSIDLFWRLSSPAIDAGHDAVFWENAAHEVVGFAAWQYYWAAFDFFISPGPDMQAVANDLFAWADQRFRELDSERGLPLPYWVEFRDDDLERRALVEAHGFLKDEYACYASFHHPLTELKPVPILPEGFGLRTSTGEQEAAALAELHRAAFESNSMTTEWRARTMRAPQYRPELDLVIGAPDGSLAGYCLGWFDAVHQVAQVEPIGVHPRFQRLGLGRVLLLEILQRFKECGASEAIIEPDLNNPPIHRASESVGFRQVQTIRRKGKLLS